MRLVTTTQAASQTGQPLKVRSRPLYPQWRSAAKGKGGDVLGFEAQPTVTTVRHSPAFRYITCRQTTDEPISTPEHGLTERREARISQLRLTDSLMSAAGTFILTTVLLYRSSRGQRPTWDYLHPSR